VVETTETTGTDASGGRTESTRIQPGHASTTAPAWRVRKAALPLAVQEEARRLERIEQALRSNRQS
jgi:hypothetical protein